MFTVWTCGQTGFSLGIHIPSQKVPPGTYTTVSNTSRYLRYGTTGSLRIEYQDHSCRGALSGSQVVWRSPARTPRQEGPGTSEDLEESDESDGDGGKHPKGAQGLQCYPFLLECGRHLRKHQESIGHEYAGGMPIWPGTCYKVYMVMDS